MKRYGWIDLISWMVYSAITLGVLVACLTKIPIELFINVLVIAGSFSVLLVSVLPLFHTWFRFGEIKRGRRHSKANKDLSLVLAMTILLVSVGTLYLPTTFIAVTGFSWIIWEISLAVTIRLHLDR